MGNIISFLSGKKTYFFVLAYVILQLINGGGLEGLANLNELGPILLAAAIGALRAGVAKIGAAAAKPPA